MVHGGQTKPIILAVLVFLGTESSAQPVGPSNRLPKLMGRDTVTEPSKDEDGLYPKGPASECIGGLPHKQCYIAPKDYGNSPELSVVQLELLRYCSRQPAVESAAGKFISRSFGLEQATT